MPQGRAGSPGGRSTLANSLHNTAYGDSPQCLLSFSDPGPLASLKLSYLKKLSKGLALGPSLLTLAVPLIDEKLIALLAAAFKAAHRVAANVVTATVVQAALVYVWGHRTKGRESKVMLEAGDDKETRSLPSCQRHGRSRTALGLPLPTPSLSQLSFLLCSCYLCPLVTPLPGLTPRGRGKMGTSVRLSGNC